MTRASPGLLCGLLLWTAGCGASLVRPDEGDACRPADPRAWYAKASDSLEIARYRPEVVYDLDADDRPVRFQPGPLPPDSEAVLSYPDPERFRGGDEGFQRMRGRSFVYDDALVVLWRTSRGDLDGARRILQTLAALQRPDGAWGFGFHVLGDGFYNAAYVRTGTVAWATYAVARYQKASQDRRFAKTLDKAVRWLLAQKDPATGLLRAGSGRWITPTRFEPTYVADFTATEHVLDAWYALRAAAEADPQLDQELGLQAAASDLAAAIEAKLWLEDEQRYAQGAGPDFLDRHSALDAAGTWAALYAWSQQQPQRAGDVLGYVQRVHAVQVAGWSGLRPYAGQPPETWFVEGTLARPLALHRLGRTAQARQELQPTVDLACAGGVPLVYSPVWAPDFPLSPAAAPTVWFLFTAAEVVVGEPPFLWSERMAPAAVVAPVR